MRVSMLIALVAVGTTVVSVGIVGQAHSQTIENRHVYSLANELADDVELIREVMGRPYDDSPRLPVSGVTLFEVYFQAQTLLLKSSQLARELTGAELGVMPSAPTLEVDAADIYRLIEPALNRIRLVTAELGIGERVPQEPRDAPISPTGIFSVVIDTNRQLNLLLDRATPAADVYDELNYAIAYAASALLSRGYGAEIPDAPFEGHKRPADVYTRILECLDIVAGIAAGVGIEVVNLSTRRNVPDDVEPGHVYDLANILVADIAMIAMTLDAAQADIDPAGVRPKHVFPSHAYERAGVLKALLERLAEVL